MRLQRRGTAPPPMKLPPPYRAPSDDSDESDIDILIIVHHDNQELEKVIDNLVVDFILEKEEVISPHVMTEEHFNKTKDYSFLKTVMAEGVPI